MTDDIIYSADAHSAEIIPYPKAPMETLPDGGALIEIRAGLYFDEERRLYSRKKPGAPLTLVKSAPYPVRVERIFIDEGTATGKEVVEYELVLDAALNRRRRQARIALKDMVIPGKLSAVLEGLPGCVMGRGLDLQIRVIQAQCEYFPIPIVYRPAATGFTRTSAGDWHYVWPSRERKTVLQNGLTQMIAIEDGSTLLSLPRDNDWLGRELAALATAEEIADPLGRLALLRGLHYRGLVSSLVPLATFAALVGTPGAGKTLSAKHAGGREINGNHVDFRFSELTKAGAEARLRGLRDVTMIGDDFNYSDYTSPARRQQINELVDMLGRSAFDGGEMRQLATGAGVELSGFVCLTGERFDPGAGLWRRMVLFRYGRGECTWPAFIAAWERWQRAHDETSRAIINFVLRCLAAPQGRNKLVALIRKLDDATKLKDRLAARFPAIDRNLLYDIATNYNKGLAGLRLAAHACGADNRLMAAGFATARQTAERHAMRLIKEIPGAHSRDDSDGARLVTVRTTPKHTNSHMRTLAIVSSKGGAGKTTLALNLAAAAGAAGLAAAVFDLDPQANATESVKLRDRPFPAAIIRATPERLPDLLEKAREQDADLILLDTPSNATWIVHKAIAVADVILIPCRPTILDLKTIDISARLARESQKPFFIVINAAPSRGSDADECRDILASHGVVAPVTLCQRSDYSRGGFYTAFDFNPHGKAASEIEALLTWLRKETCLGRTGRKVRNSIKAPHADADLIS